MSENHTIEGFEQLSKQQIFDMAIAHIQKTRKKSTRQDAAVCLYDGIGCAASVFLQPESRADMDYLGDWESLVTSGRVPNHESSLVISLQDAHDGADKHDFMPEWSQNMQRLAVKYGLDDSKLEKL